jgi:hypothetical protein
MRLIASRPETTENGGKIMESEDFRKPFDYEDEHGVAGWILFFVSMAVILDGFIGFSVWAEGYQYLHQMPAIATLYWIGSLIFIALIGGICLTLYKIPRFALKAVYTYLIYRVIFLSIAFIMIYYFRRSNPNIIGQDVNQFDSMWHLTLNSIVIPLPYTIAFSIIWYLYFQRSKRVREAYGVPRA